MIQKTLVCPDNDGIANVLEYWEGSTRWNQAIQRRPSSLTPIPWDLIIERWNREDS